jgi:hypothetical protein
MDRVIVLSTLGYLQSGMVASFAARGFLLLVLSFSAIFARDAIARDPRRDQVVELKTAEGLLFFRMKLDYIGKTQDPAYLRKIDADIRNADFYVRTYENLGRGVVEFVQTVTRRASGENVTVQTPNGPTFGSQSVIDHALKPRFGKDGNILAEGRTIRQHNIFVSFGQKPDNMIQKTTIRYQGLEYSFDDVLVYLP